MILISAPAPNAAQRDSILDQLSKAESRNESDRNRVIDRFMNDVISGRECHEQLTAIDARFEQQEAALLDQLDQLDRQQRCIVPAAVQR